MLAKELIGKNVTRSNCVIYGNGIKDYSYCGSILQIVNANDFIIAYKHTEGIFDDNEIRYLDMRFCDNNWECMDEFILQAESVSESHD